MLTQLYPLDRKHMHSTSCLHAVLPFTYKLGDEDGILYTNIMRMTANMYTGSPYYDSTDQPKINPN